MRRFLILLLCCAEALQAQKPKNYTVVTDELVQRIATASILTTPVRLAVVPFTATKSSAESSSQFGEYLTETVIGSLGNHADKIKLFERTRLDAILKEHEFILTDLMKPAAALKIGQLAPIDALLSGTYTKLKSYIDVSARLMDVASGEIMMSYNGRIKMNKNLAALFPANDNSPASVNAIQSETEPVPVHVTINNTINSSTGQDGGLQYQLITILGKIGKDAAAAEKSISRILTLTTNSDVRYAAEAALQAIQQN